MISVVNAVIEQQMFLDERSACIELHSNPDPIHENVLKKLLLPRRFRQASIFWDD